MVNRIEPTSARDPQAQAINSQASTKPPVKPPKESQPGGVEADELQISDEALARLRTQSDSTRTSSSSGDSDAQAMKVEALRRQVQNGAYQVSDEALADKLLIYSRPKA
ncbi:MAG: flagellar biosynthesis anti-sigma factor FlgM [Chloroflexi bacterium]|nr:flagellar biosynthesis anti-sigma factor FlgM [Chloroflexota bacterium]